MTHPLSSFVAGARRGWSCSGPACLESFRTRGVVERRSAAGAGGDAGVAREGRGQRIRAHETCPSIALGVGRCLARQRRPHEPMSLRYRNGGKEGRESFRAEAAPGALGAAGRHPGDGACLRLQPQYGAQVAAALRGGRSGRFGGREPCAETNPAQDLEGAGAEGGGGATAGALRRGAAPSRCSSAWSRAWARSRVSCARGS